MCAVCILSAALIYQDYVLYPRQNRELVEELKTCFPEDIPPGGGSPRQKEEQAGRELEVPAVDLRSLQRQYPDVRGWLTIQEVGSIIRSCRAAGRSGVLSAEGLPGKLRHQWKFVPPGRLYFGRIKESDDLRSQHEQQGDVRESGPYASYDYWKAHPKVFFQTPEGMEEYWIGAVLKADVSMFDFQQASFQSPQELEAYVAQAKALSLFETG